MLCSVSIAGVRRGKAEMGMADKASQRRRQENRGGKRCSPSGEKQHAVALGNGHVEGSLGSSGAENLTPGCGTRV